jgi:hypothetical protein
MPGINSRSPRHEPLAMSTASEMAENGPMWDSMIARYGLFPTPYEQIANWPFIDFMLNLGEETILSTIKIRQAGFADCIDTHETFRRQLGRLRDLRRSHKGELGEQIAVGPLP